MAFTNLFRRYSSTNESRRLSYAYIDGDSTAETLLNELEAQCQNNLIVLSSKTKGHSEVFDSPVDLLASARTLSSKRSSVDYSWLCLRRYSLQTQDNLYHLPDMVKMELSELIRNVLPKDCTLVINQFRQYVRAQDKGTTPENVIVLFRKTLTDYIDQKHKNRSSSQDRCRTDEENNLRSRTQSLFMRANRILPNYQSEGRQYSTTELSEISLTSEKNHLMDNKPRSNTST